MGETILASVHEAGHIMVAYLMGFKVIQVALDEQGNGMTQIDYGEFTKIITPLLVMDICPEFDSCLNRLNKEALHELGERICMVLVAGHVSENIYLNNGKESSTLGISITGSDLTRVDAISKYLNLSVEKILKQTYHFLKDENVWSPLKILADTIVSNKKLSQHDIHISLINSKYIDFIENS